MPCYDGRSDRSDKFIVTGVPTVAYQAVKRRLDMVTALLCDVCQNMDPDKMKPELQKWWLDHKAFDERRKHD